MDPAEFVDIHPRLFHMAEIRALPGIERHGLLSVSTIFDVCGIEGKNRRNLESERRMESVEVGAPDGTVFTIRDQKPLNPKKLAACLDGMTVREWLRLLNGMVFLWPRRKRCEELLRARAYRNRSHLVLEIDAAGLVERHADRIRLSPINTGAVLFNPARRGPHTFETLEGYPFDEWRKKRSRSTAIAEVAVQHAIPDVMDLVVGTWQADKEGWRGLG